MSGPAPGSYQVVYFDAVRQQARELGRRAVAAGRGQKTLTALRTIDRRLHSDPSDFGEAQFHYHGLKLEFRTAAVSPLAVHFTVHETKTVVFVVRLQAMGGDENEE